jgi:hypothetical protein
MFASGQWSLCVYIYVYVCVGMCIYIYIYVCVCMYLWVCMCVCGCVCMCGYVCVYFLSNFIKQHVPLQESNTTCWRFLYISFVLYCTMYSICYLLVCCFSAYFSLFSFLFVDVIRLALTKINSLLCASYKVSKFIELTNIWNNLVCLFARSELDSGQSVCLLRQSWTAANLFVC